VAVFQPNNLKKQFAFYLHAALPISAMITAACIWVMNSTLLMIEKYSH